MEELLQISDWITILVSFVLAFGFGWLWYSPYLFLKPWAAAAGLSLDGPKDGMGKAMFAQAVATFLLTVVTNMAYVDGHVGHALIVAVMAAFFVMSSNHYKKQGCTVARVEGGYILAMAILMVIVNMVL